MDRTWTTHFARSAMAFGLMAASFGALAGSSSAAHAKAPAAAPVPQAVPAARYLAAASAAQQVASVERQAPHRAHEARQAEVQERKLRVRHLRSTVVSVARQQVGDTYSAGGDGPNRFDCSGLTKYVFRKATGKHLPHQSRAQYSKVARISKAKAQPGDLVFFFRNGAHHVGIYIGKGKMVDAVGYGRGVQVSPISGSWWSRSYTGMGRLLPTA